MRRDMEVSRVRARETVHWKGSIAFSAKAKATEILQFDCSTK